jgi:hypothetical protein
MSMVHVVATQPSFLQLVYATRDDEEGLAPAPQPH